MKQHQKLTLVLCLIWIITLLYGEMFAFFIPSLTCSWPSSSSSSIDGADGFSKVAVIADAQIMDRTSHRLVPKSLALEILQFFTDLYMRRAFFSSIMPFKPDIILFLGDHFDGGPYLSDEEWQESLSRFKHIFGLRNEDRYKDIPVYYLVGNHDVGYAALLAHKPEIVARYEKEFGKRNYRFTVGKVEFIAVDAQTLDGHPAGTQTSATWEFVKNVSVDFQMLPRVLLTHIPLYRRDDTPCGSHRNSELINQRIVRTVHSREILYQNYITEESSNRLLDLVKPVLVLSGHDHDQCTVTHESNHETIKEHTVGTLSWQQGNLFPSFLLLSASNSALLNTSNLEEAVSTHLCFLPMQTFIYIGYMLLLIVTVLALYFWPASGMNFGSLLISCNVFKFGNKEKNEDENCEYEMVWDAEGSMHLVRKAINTPNTHSTDRSGMAESQGNAVMRPTAKKISSQDVEISINLEDPVINMPPRTSKSATRFVIHRLLRVIRMLTVIALVNIPLYMMLLFKDWIDQ